MTKKMLIVNLIMGLILIGTVVFLVVTVRNHSSVRNSGYDENAESSVSMNGVLSDNKPVSNKAVIVETKEADSGQKPKSDETSASEYANFERIIDRLIKATN